MAAETATDSTGLTQSDIIRRYYTERDYFLSPEGILKALSAILIVLTTAVSMGGGICSGASLVVDNMNIALMVLGAVLCLMYTTVLLGLPSYAPQCCLYADIILSAATGVLMLTMTVLSAVVCSIADFIQVLHFPMMLLNTVLLIASIVVMYINVMTHSELARTAMPPRAPTPIEQEV